MTQTERRTNLPFVVENDAEVARLLTLHRELSAWMGGALPPKLDIAQVKRVLDVGCGIGAWVHEVAQQHPQMHVFGIDTSPFCIEQARSLTRNLYNVTLLEQDMHTLEGVFNPDSFDLIHLRFMAGTVSVTQFPQLLASLTRLCKRKGILILTEAELPLTSSHACDYLSSLILSAMISADMAFTPAFTPQLGLMSRLRYWTRTLGYTHQLDDTLYLDISRSASAYTIFTQQTAILGQHIRPFIINTGQISPTEFDDLFTELQQEIAARGFYGACPIQTLVAVNAPRFFPLEGNRTTRVSPHVGHL